MEDKRVFKHNDYRFEINNINARSENVDGNSKMTVYGCAVKYNDKTVLYKNDEYTVYEVIDRNALLNVDDRDCFLKYNHDSNFALARTKNNSLRLENRDDGLYIEADIIDTQQGRDLFKMIKEGLINKMSFAFTIAENGREIIEDENSVVYRITKINKLYDVAAVCHPAYENTEIFARSIKDVEAYFEEKKKAEALRLRKIEKDAVEALTLKRQEVIKLIKK